MPEQITKYPDVTLQVLREGGAVCGQGAPQNILKQCPRERFCSLRTGEVCIYGIGEIPTMTQITTQELANVVCPQARKAALFPGGDATLVAALLVAVFLSGVGLGRFWRNKKPVRARQLRTAPELSVSGPDSGNH
jgi:hypothetical protein